MITGSCLCGDVRYRAERAAAPLVHCHCEMCRKVHGTAFASVLLVERAGFRWLSGEAQLTRYESSPGKQRCFCSRCGAHVVSIRPADERTILLRAGSIDAGVDTPGVAHGWVASKAPWYEITDELARFERDFPAREDG